MAIRQCTLSEITLRVSHPGYKLFWCEQKTRTRPTNQLRFSTIEKEIRSTNRLPNFKMIDNINSLKSKSLGLNTSTPLFQTLRQTPVQKLNNRPSFYILKPRKLKRVYLFRVLYAVDFLSLT